MNIVGYVIKSGDNYIAEDYRSGFDFKKSKSFTEAIRFEKELWANQFVLKWSHKFENLAVKPLYMED